MQKYRLVAKKGEGTFSEVLKAQSVKSNRYTAIKCMKNRFDSIEQVRASTLGATSDSPALASRDSHANDGRSIISERFRPYVGFRHTQISSSLSRSSTTSRLAGCA